MKPHHLLLALIVLVGSAAVAQPVWKPVMYCVKFTVHSITGDVSGTLKGLEGNLMIDSARPERSFLTASVEPGTINTGNKLRDKHLTKSDYFDATAYPRITIVSVAIEKKQRDVYAGTFDLTIKGTTRRIDIPFTFVQKGNRCEFVGTFTIDRRMYDIGKSTMILANQVTISLVVDGQVKSGQPGSSEIAAQ